MIWPSANGKLSSPQSNLRIGTLEGMLCPDIGDTPNKMVGVFLLFPFKPTPQKRTLHKHELKRPVETLWPVELASAITSRQRNWLPCKTEKNNSEFGADSGSWRQAWGFLQDLSKVQYKEKKKGPSRCRLPKELKKPSFAGETPVGTWTPFLGACHAHSRRTSEGPCHSAIGVSPSQSL